MKNKALKEYEQRKSNSQLESMDRYTWAKSYLRELNNQGVDVSRYFSFLVGRHYTLKESEFNRIKKFYDKLTQH